MKKPDFAGKHIILGVTGGIAAYKSVQLLRLLKQEEAIVRVVMTKNAAYFVGEATFAALSGQKVMTTLFDAHSNAAIRHIEYAQEAEMAVIAPATANLIGKLANGIADDALTTLLLAVTAPVLICPSMNTQMFLHPAVSRNIETLKQYGYHVAQPGEGDLACGVTGPGRLPEPGDILSMMRAIASRH